jgi:ADP-heptose:LPS heptosyltransferase
LSIEDLVEPKPKLLIFELWGIGDLVLTTTLIAEAQAHYEVHLLAKPHATELLAPSFPDLIFHTFDAPWTAFYGKYRLWQWSWGALTRLVFKLRREKFDAAVSIRTDPRDHLLMWLVRSRQRHGFPIKGSQVFLTHRMVRGEQKQHKVNDWRSVGASLSLSKMNSAEPRIFGERYRTPRIETLLRDTTDPIVCLHAGARIAVRRWPSTYFEQIIRRLRECFRFHLLLIPDLDGFGANLEPLADQVLTQLSLRQMVGALSRSDLLLCNDSGPMHVAAASGCPVIAFFGPTDPGWFYPWGDANKIIIQDICPYRPCFDYCRFKEPYCLTKLLPEYAWPQVHQHIMTLIGRGRLPALQQTA